MQKIQLYIVSLWLLFLLIAVKECVFVSWHFSFTRQGVYNLLSVNVVPSCALFFAILGVFFYARFQYRLKGSTLLPKKIKKLEDQSYEHLTFLTTYIVPFLRVKLVGRDLLITVLLLIIIGAIFIKTNLFYKNPTLALLGYKLYKADTEKDQGLIFLTRNNLKVGDSVHYIPLKDNIYFVKL
jgi:hypothetical protein